MWPNKPGAYWFYGFAQNKEVDSFPRLHLVVVEYVSKLFGVRYMTGRSSLRKETGAYGLWTSMDVPDLPELDDVFERQADVAARKIKKMEDLEFIG